MIKIRIEGTEQETTEAVERMRNSGCFNITTISDFFLNRRSDFGRVYIDAEIKAKPTDAMSHGET